MVREVTGCGHTGALCLGTAVIMALMSAQHAASWQGRWHLEVPQPPGPVQVGGLCQVASKLTCGLDTSSGLCLLASVSVITAC